MPDGNSIALTQLRVENLPLPASGRVEYRDAKQPGLYLRVSATGVKSWRLVKRGKGGKLERVTLGTYPGLSVGRARELAQKALGRVLEGGSPAADKRRAKLMETTFGEAFETFLHRRPLKESTKADYRTVVNCYIPQWLALPLLRIDETAIKAMHADITARAPSKGNHVMRIVRGVWNFSREEFKLDGQRVLPESPTNALTAQRLWNRERRRTTTIPRAKLPAWYAAVDGLRNRAARDYILTLLLTGLRANEGAGLPWSNIDFIARTLTIRNPKNHRDHSLPLPPYLFKLLRAREGNGSPFVFEGRAGGKPDGFYASIKLAGEAAGFHFTPHDLRRTFATAAEGLGLGAYTIRRLLNHSSGADVTGGYIVQDAESLREPMARISAFFLREMGVAVDDDCSSGEPTEPSDLRKA